MNFTKGLTMKIFLTTLILSSALFLNLNVQAKEENKKIDMKLLGTIDQSSLDKIAPVEQKVEKQEVAAKSKVAMNCTDKMGRVYKQGEIGYDTCLAEIQLNHQDPKNQKNKNSTNTQPGAGFSIKIGD